MKREIIPAKQIARSIYLLRGQKVLLDFDLAALYGVATKVLNQAVKRNRERFPDDFMFQLTTSETSFLRSQFVTLKEQDAANEGVVENRSQFVTGFFKHRETRSRRYAFTEQGVAMLSSVLNSEHAGDRTRLACWRWRPRHRELFLNHRTQAFARLRRGFPARRRKEHARRVCSPIREA